MAVLYTEHFVQFFDSNGNPLSNGKLYAYSAGTTTPKATYTTEAATVEHAHPIVLDSSGRQTIFIQGSYRFDLYDANDVLIKSTDDVTSFTTLSEAGDPFFQSFSGNASQTVFTLSESLGDDSKDIMVYVDAGGGLGYDIQNPSAYTLSGASLTFNSAPASGTNNIYVFAPTKQLGAAAAAAAAAAASEAAAATSETLAEEWATKTDGIVDSTDYSSKAFAIGGTGVTNTATRGAAKEWATKTGGTVDTAERSAKAYAQEDLTGLAGGSAKDWAVTAEDTEVTTGLYSALHYAAKAGDSATAAAASASASASSAAALSGTSTTSVAIGTGSTAFTTQAGKQFDVGSWLLIVSDADEANYMHGQVTAYSSTSLTVNVTNVGGSGTFADWNITVSGTRGATGAQGPAGNIGDISGLPSATITASDEVPFADVDDSGDSKKATVGEIIDVMEGANNTFTGDNIFQGIVDVTNINAEGSSGGALRNSGGTNCVSWGGGAGQNFSITNTLSFGAGGATVDIVRDEDDMASDDPNALATQQSIKAYVDNNSGGGNADLVVFTSSGTWTKDAGLVGVFVTVVGGGGNGGTGSGSYTGAGGGGGGTSIKWIQAASLGATETVTVGGASGTSSFGTHCSATGGSTGGGGANGTGGAGGSGSGGSINIVGQAGAQAAFADANHPGSLGGSSTHGGGGVGVASAGGGAGGNYGGGGGGATRNTGAGGAGAGGIVIVQEVY